MEKRLLAEGDEIVYHGRWGQAKTGRVKNLTKEKSYRVAYVHYSVANPKRVTSLYVVNDKGLKFSYSVKNFVLPDGILWDEAEVVAEAIARDRQAASSFQEDLRSL
jgi:hypothetical protein